MQGLQVGSITIHCCIRGEGKPFVFIHGNAFTHWAWKHQLDHFERNYRVVAPDLRGHGRSDKPEGPYPISSFVDDLVGLLDVLSINRAVLAGESFGGRVVLSFAIHHPNRVAGMVLIGTSAKRNSRATKQIERVKSQGLENEIRELVQFLSGPSMSDKTKREIIQEQLNTPERVRIELWRTVDSFDVSDRLSRIEKPTLVIVGELDKGTPVSESRQLHEGIKGSRLMILPDVGHFAMIEAPTLVNRHIEDFLAQQVGY